MIATLDLIGGARPNFMKIAPLARALERHRDRVAPRIVHTGQHYDREMSGVFFEELGIPSPDHHLDCGSGSHAEQTARIMIEYERLCNTAPPALVVVVGDVNSTLACSIVAKKLQIPVAHVEAGLRSGDRSMPEEINRLATDAITDMFFVTEPSGLDNLRREGHAEDAIHVVGQVMVDNLMYQRRRLESSPLAGGPSVDYKGQHGAYGVVTMHRPSNVDDDQVFRGLAGALREISNELPLAFPVHPRTRRNMDRLGIDLGPAVTLLPPLGYMEFLNLWKDAVMVLTDSGGLQEETTALGIPCLTLRENTERPITVEQGTNTVVGTAPARIVAAAREVRNTACRPWRCPALWDGHAAERIVDVVLRHLDYHSCAL